MFDRKTYSYMKRVGIGVEISKKQLKQEMIETLLQLPEGTSKLKEAVISHLGVSGQMISIKELNNIWNQVKKSVAKSNPDKFILDNRNVLHWNDGSVKILDKNISPTNYKKLNELANNDNCSVNAIVSKLIKVYVKSKA